MQKILQAWAQGAKPQPSEVQQLAVAELADTQRAAAFGVTPDTVTEMIQQRSQFFQSLLKQSDRLPNLPHRLTLLWTLWLPLATQLIQQYQVLGHPLVQGLLGGQGTGKTTLGQALTVILEHLGYRMLSFSIDDLYKTYHEREQLRQQDPRLIWRGPPGTHDVEFGIQVLDQLRHPKAGQLIEIPQFDKSLWQGAGDRIESKWIEPVDIILFEGWFVGCRPINIIQFETAPHPIITETDRQFARDINQKLYDYLPLWQCVDRLMILNPVDYRLSKQWRKQAEQKMIATGKSGMSEVEIDQFVDYFWKALHPEFFIHPLVKNRAIADLVVEINGDHSVGQIN